MLPNKLLIGLFGTFNLMSCSTSLHDKTQTDCTPNIVIFLSDDQGWGDLSIKGNSNLSTPNIDKIGENGVSFNHFYVCAVCSPTRAEMLTGRYHPRGGVYSTSAGGERLNLDETCISEVFKKAGYVTAAYGKWHNGMQYPYHPNARGFDDFYGFCSGHWGNYFSPMLEHNGELVKGNGFCADDFTNHALNFIDNNEHSPFFLYLPFNIPHSPMQVPDTFWNKFSHTELKMRNRDPEKENVQFTKAALAMCENIDWNVGRVINKLKELGLEENTIVLYFSDNGPNEWRWNDGMKGKKGSVDEGGVRSPLLIQWKGTINKGTTIDQIAGVIDLLPTLTDLAGIECNTNKPIDGISLKPLIIGDSFEWEDRLIFNHWGKSTSVRSQRYKLDGKNKLFDMENDPGQYIDISNKEPEIKNHLLIAKQDWEKEVLAERPEKDKRPFPIGHNDFIYSQIPARDGVPHGNIQRSSKYPNCSFFTNWININDSITWDVEVLNEGDFEVSLYYTCPKSDLGSVFELSLGKNKIESSIKDPFDPPLEGMENDRVERIESYVKDFKKLNIGNIHLEKGKGTLKLQAKSIPGKEVMDFRLLMFKRI
jgi:arylsulfatase A-like enzyme